MSMSKAGDAKSRELIQTVSKYQRPDERGQQGHYREAGEPQESHNRNPSNGNMLIEDFPGLAKTLMANTFSSALGCKFKRVQFTPDLLPPM